MPRGPGASARGKGPRAGMAVALVAAALSACPAAAEVSPASEPTAPVARVERAASIVADVLDRYLAHPSYSIRFVQESYWALADTVKETAGVLLVEGSGRLSLEYADGGRAVADGETLRVFVPETRQFFVTALDPADIAVDPARILAAYEPDRRAPIVGDDDGPAITIGMRPRERYGEPARIEATVDRNSLELVGLVAFSSTGDRTTYRITETRFDVETSDQDFKLPRPEGAELIRGSPFGAPGASAGMD